MHRSPRAFAPGASSRGLFLAAALLALVVPARADVMLKERTVSSGLAGFGNATSERTTVIAGDRSRTDETNTYTGRFQTLAGGGKARQSVQITRLDRELFWNLDPQKKEYSELGFAEMRSMMAAGAGQLQAGQDRRQDVPMEYSVTVRRTGKKEKVNGFDAEQFVVTLTATPKGESAGPPAGSYTITMDQWLASGLAGSDEVQAYYRRFAEKMGLDPRMQAAAGGMMAQYGEAMKQMAEKMKDMKGYPVRSTVTVSMGPQVSPEDQARLDKARADAQAARAQDRKQKDEQEDAAAADNAGDAIARGNVSGALGGMLGHRLGKALQKKAEPSTTTGAGSSGAQGGGLTITTDVVSITTGPANASYDVPADYRKVERRQH